jgi:ribosomal protein S12 methylthiotransferase
VKDVEFDHVGVFTYSHEEGTPAYARQDDIPARVKTRRRNRLMAAQRRIVQRSQRRRCGERVRVLIDGPAPEHGLVLRGRLESQAPDIDSCVYLTDVDPTAYRAGDFLDGIVEGAREYDLVVRPLPGVQGG